MIAAFIAQFGPLIVGILTVIGSALVALFSIKKAAKAEGKAVAAETIAKDREEIAANAIQKAKAEREKHLEIIENAIKANNEVNSLGAGDAASELQRNWARDGSKAGL